MDRAMQPAVTIDGDGCGLHAACAGPSETTPAAAGSVVLGPSRRTTCSTSSVGRQTFGTRSSRNMAGETHPSRGGLFVVAGPSGVGKGTVVRRVLEIRPGLELSVSATTRSPRPG